MIPAVIDISMANENMESKVFHPNSFKTKKDTGKHGMDRAIIVVAIVASRAVKGRLSRTIGAA